MKKQLLFLALLFTLTTNAQTTAIPDANFEQKLIDLGIDTNGLNGNILDADAAAVTSLDISLQFVISDITGIEAFVNLTHFNCALNNIGTLDLSQNTALQVLNTSGNIYTTIDLSNNPNLIDVDVRGSFLTTVDLRNGNNAAITSFYANTSPNLTCVFVDNAANSYSGWYIDANGSYVNNETECANLSSNSFDETTFTIYPNPVSDFLSITSESTISKTEIFDLSGKKILESKHNILDVKSFSSGIYVVKVTNINGNISVLKFYKK